MSDLPSATIEGFLQIRDAHGPNEAKMVRSGCEVSDEIHLVHVKTSQGTETRSNELRDV